MPHTAHSATPAAVCALAGFGKAVVKTDTSGADAEGHAPHSALQILGQAAGLCLSPRRDGPSDRALSRILWHLKACQILEGWSSRQKRCWMRACQPLQPRFRQFDGFLADTVDPLPQAKAAGGCAALRASQELVSRDCDHTPGVNLGRSWVKCVHAQRM